MNFFHCGIKNDWVDQDGCRGKTICCPGGLSLKFSLKCSVSCESFTSKVLFCHREDVVYLRFCNIVCNCEIIFFFALEGIACDNISATSNPIGDMF